MRLILVGFGTVGQGLAQILQNKTETLQSQYGFHAEIVGVATGSRGILYHPDGLSISGLLDAIAQGNLEHYPKDARLRSDFASATELIRAAEGDVVIEVSPTNIETAQPALSHFEAALETGKHIVTANKGPIALQYPALREQALQQRLQLRFESTVMAGTPVIGTGLELLAGCTIKEVRGILNGTTNYMLTQMAAGMTYDDALQQAQELGYAETDPTADVEGWDAAAKVLILLAAFFDRIIPLSEVSVTGITNITQQDIQTAQSQGQQYKLIATLSKNVASVEPIRLPADDPLAQVGGATNALTFSTDLMGDVTIIGAGAGAKETGFGLLADLLAIHRVADRSNA